MSQGRIVGEIFLAECRVCRTWQEVQAQVQEADLYFEFWQATFRCCDVDQTAWFTVEKVDDDIH